MREDVARGDLVVVLDRFCTPFPGLYLYYPAPKEAFDQIVQVRTSAIYAVKLGHKEEAIRQIQQWDLLTRKLQVGVFIRTGRMDPEVTQVTEDLRERLEDLRDALLADNLSEAKDDHLPKVEEAYRRCREAYRSGPDAKSHAQGGSRDSAE